MVNTANANKQFLDMVKANSITEARKNGNSNKVGIHCVADKNTQATEADILYQFKDICLKAGIPESVAVFGLAKSYVLANEAEKTE